MRTQSMIYKSMVVVLLGFSLCGQSIALDLGLSDMSKEQKVWTVNLGAMALITAWGVTMWDDFDRSPHIQSEGWYGQNTDEGGADKLGHLWSSYTLGDGLAHVYQGWGYEPDRAAFNGVLSSFALMSFMEFGDSFSNYGFSYEDMLMNTVGSASSYLLYKYPGLNEKIDLRWEYKPDFKKTDFLTDYQNTKYLIALQLDGFDQFRDTPLGYLELQMGYYFRGIDTHTPDRERNLYVGIGLDLGKLLSKAGCGSFCTIFHYYQAPYTYFSTKSKL